VVSRLPTTLLSLDRRKDDSPVAVCASDVAYQGAIAIALFFVGHWTRSLFCQTFFLHRYASHRMFTMGKGWGPMPSCTGTLTPIARPSGIRIQHAPRIIHSRGCGGRSRVITTSPIPLLPVRFLVGVIHGAIVNGCGHRYEYRNFDSKDDARNTLPFDFLTLRSGPELRGARLGARRFTGHRYRFVNDCRRFSGESASLRWWNSGNAAW